MNTAHVETLIKISDRIIETESHVYKRELYKDIEFDARLVMLKGCRGVGKTTLLRQYIKDFPDKKIYLSLDHIYFTYARLVEYAETFYEMGYRCMILDEVHKYADWSIELKNIYDFYPDMKLLVTASSALNIATGAADLSRRADVYTMRGLNFREYMVLEHGIQLQAYSFTELLANYDEIYVNYFVNHDIKRRFNKYLHSGYYPFYKEAGRRYPEKQLAMLNQVLEVDIPAIFNIDYESIRQVKKLLALIARISPFTPNIANMARDLSISRTSILRYLDFLEAAGIIHILKSNNKSDSVLTKPDKIYMENTNLLYALSGELANIGTVRETFVMNALSKVGKVSTPAKGDLLFDNSYTIEIGGADKNFHQIANMPNPVLIKEGIDRGATGILPMWMLGLLG